MQLKRARNDQSCHSHTLFRNVAIETFLPFISTIHGCSSMRHGVALRGCSFSRLLNGSQSGHKQTTIRKTLPALNEVFEIITPFDVVVGLIFQHWYWLSDDICE